MTEQKDLLQHQAILQRDKETYALVPHLPGGITDTNTLRKIADIADKYGCQAVKVTSAQRIALVGIKEEDVENFWSDLNLPKGHAIGKVVRSVKICPGTTFCKRGRQDSVSIGLMLDKKYHGMELPNKTKIGVSGCANNCAENAIKDIGLMGTPKGFNITVGGCAGGRARLAELLFTDKTSEEALTIVDKIIEVYKGAAKGGQRIGFFIEKVGLENFKKCIEAAEKDLSKLIKELKEHNV